MLFLEKIITVSINFYNFNLSFTANYVLMDASEPWQLGFQDPASPIMEGIIDFHYDLMFFIIVICIFVLWMLLSCIHLFKSDFNAQDDRSQLFTAYSQGVAHNTGLEIVWTIVPAFILMIIAVPSFALLYSMEELVEPTFTVKVTGNQWYWQYEYSNCKNLDIADQIIDGKKFDSYMIPTSDLEEGNLRLLEVDNRLMLPVNTHIQVVITAADVLHCWAVPSLGVKVDACPGRLNQTTMFIKREGVFYGQCSEICGVNHGFMPIVVNGVSMKDFLQDRYMDNLLALVEENPELDGFEIPEEDITFLSK
jgi:cytochrome c oxidase subunit 2